MPIPSSTTCSRSRPCNASTSGSMAGGRAARRRSRNPGSFASSATSIARWPRGCSSSRPRSTPGSRPTAASSWADCRPEAGRCTSGIRAPPNGPVRSCFPRRARPSSSMRLIRSRWTISTSSGGPTPRLRTMARIADLIPGTLGGRIFLLSGALVTAAMIVAVSFTAWRAKSLAGESVTRSLDGALATQVEFGRARATQLRLTSRVVAGDPSFVAYAAESDAASVRDLLFERQRELECDWSAVLDRTGRLIAHTGRVAPADRELATSAVVAGALRGAETVGLLKADDRYYFCTAIPLVAGGTSLEGVLVLGLIVDDAYLLQMKRQSGAEVAMIVRRPDERVLSTTLATGPDLLAAIRSRGALETLIPVHGRKSHVELEIEGRRWAAVAHPVFGADDPTGLLAVTLASLDEAVAPYRRIEQVLLLTGAAALLAAFLLSFALSRRVTRPLEQLASAVEAARRGQYEVALPSGARGEVGRLA